MLLSLDTDQNVDFLKFDATMRLKHLKLPHAAAEKFNEILHDDKIQPEEFVKELSAILKGTDSFTWKILVSLSNIQKKFIDSISQLPLIYFCLLFFVIFLFFFLDRKFKSTSRKVQKKIVGFSENIFLRVFGVLGYFVPLISLFNAYAIRLLRAYPGVNTLVGAPFIREALILYVNTPHIDYYYFFGVITICINFAFPKSRFIRFHFIRGLMIYTFEQIPLIFYQIIAMTHRATSATEYDQPFTLLMFFFVLNLYFIIPAMFEAICLSYPKRKILREAVELQLGRDDTDGFKWWDKDK